MTPVNHSQNFGGLFRYELAQLNSQSRRCVYDVIKYSPGSKLSAFKEYECLAVRDEDSKIVGDIFKELGVNFDYKKVSDEELNNNFIIDLFLKYFNKAKK